MSKQSLMLSAAMAALLAGPAYATCTSVSGTLDCITTSTTTALTTGVPWTTATITTAVGTAKVGDISIQSGGSVATSNANIGAITVNSNNYVYSVGAISNNKESSASGILIDVSKNPNASAASFANAAATTINGAGIYLDAASTLDLSGAGTLKHGIYLDSTNGNGTYTGDIIFNTGSTTEVDGDSSNGVLISNGATLTGNLSLGGTFTMNQTTATSTTASGLYGMLMLGRVQGNISIPSGGSMTVLGAGAQGVSIQGTGVTGSLLIGGSLTTGAPSPTTTTLTTNNNNIVHPEAGSALSIGANVGNGIAIFGPGFSGDTSVASAGVTAQGTSPTIAISPGLNTVVNTPTYSGGQTASLVVGVYGDTNDPGFSFYNRGSVSATPADANRLAGDSNNAMAMRITGASTFPTILTGGIFNSGAITASAGSTGTVAPATAATAMYIDSYAVIGANLGAKNPTVSAINPGDQAALVNTNAAGSGTISATVSGTRGGTATAIVINANASVPSIINSGTIVASATTTDVTITNPLQAIAIEDLSGALTSVINTGTISAFATTLDSNAQVIAAIDLSNGNTATPSGAGVTVIDQSTSTTSATITGGIHFGTGDNQVLTINGTGPTHFATVTGDVSYGAGTVIGGDRLNIGSYGELVGKVTSFSGSGVAVDVAQFGVLSLQNSTATLFATDFHVESYGALSLGVSKSLTSSGVVSANHSATIGANASLGVAFNSFVPQGSSEFVLITAPQGKLNVSDLTTYNTSVSTSVADGGSMPFLFTSASLRCIGTSNGCTAPPAPSATDKLVLDTEPKTAAQLGVTGYAAQVFTFANAALGGNTPLGGDDTLGAAMVNGIHNAAQAQAAYNSFAPNVTGGSRAIAISITDQATGVVGARLRMLNLYGKQEGGTTLWGQEFVQMIKDPGRGALQADGTKLLSGYKDHGFGFALGIDGGSPKYGWYGGAFTFYAGDVGELLRDSHTNEQWLLLSGYSAWRGKGLFFDSKIDVGYGHFDGKRRINLTIVSNGSTGTFTREADNKHPGTLISGGFTTGGIFSYGATTLLPQISVDGLLMREEGYTEKNPSTTTVGDGFDLKVQPYYAKSLRVFLGGSVRYDLDLWDFYLQPEAHTGLRYDIFNDPAKLKAAFAYADTTGGTAGPGAQFTITGPDPSQVNYVLGGSLAATTDTWTLGFNFDLVRGTNGAFEQVGTINLLGRI